MPVNSNILSKCTKSTNLVIYGCIYVSVSINGISSSLRMYWCRAYICLLGFSLVKSNAWAAVINSKAKHLYKFSIAWHAFLLDHPAILTMSSEPSQVVIEVVDPGFDKCLFSAAKAAAVY